MHIHNCRRVCHKDGYFRLTNLRTIHTYSYLFVKIFLQEQNQGDECNCIDLLCFNFTWKRTNRMDFETLSHDLLVVQFANYEFTGTVTQNLKEI